jgi:predicted DNA-binding WGR domain protein
MNDLVPFSDLRSMAEVMGKSGMFGKTPEQMLSLMLIAQAEGKHPAIACQEWDVIQGKPTLNSKSALARFQGSGGRIQWVERTDQKASARFFHAAGTDEKGLLVEWTMERAGKAGLTGKDNWKKFPAQMLSARVVAEGVRAVFPACLSGFYTTEEVMDFKEPRNVTEHAEPVQEHTEPPKAETPKQSPEVSAVLQDIAGLLKESDGEYLYFSMDEVAGYREEAGKILKSDSPLEGLKALKAKITGILFGKQDEHEKQRNALDTAAEAAFDKQPEIF